MIDALGKRNADLEASAENAKKARVVADALERGEPVPVVAIVPVVATAGAAIVANMPTVQQFQQFTDYAAYAQQFADCVAYARSAYQMLCEQWTQWFWYVFQTLNLNLETTQVDEFFQRQYRDQLSG